MILEFPQLVVCFDTCIWRENSCRMIVALYSASIPKVSLNFVSFPKLLVPLQVRCSSDAIVAGVTC
jgi:hypothetical protein